MPIVRCPTPADAAQVLATVTAQRGAALFVFFGSEDPGTGESWCPDCVTADPVLRRALVTLRPDLTVYECPVGQRSDWKGQANHPYRVHPIFRIERIPTVVRIEQGVAVGHLVEGDCAQPALVEAFIRAIHIKEQP